MAISRFDVCRVGVFAAALAVTVAAPASAGECDRPDPRFAVHETSEGRLYEINGKDHPELIPQHDLWSHFFHQVRTAREDDERLKQMGVAALSPGGAAALDEAVEAHRKRAEQCGWLVAGLAARLTADKATDEVKHEASCRALVKCRWVDIGSGEGLMVRLPPEDQAIVRERLEILRRNISLLVFERDMDCYALPK